MKYHVIVGEDYFAHVAMVFDESAPEEFVTGVEALEQLIDYQTILIRAAEQIKTEVERIMKIEKDQ